MDNLTRFDGDGIEIFINQGGESFSSIRGVARMAGKDDRQIRRFITADNISVINTKVPTATGLKTASLLSENDIVIILAEYNVERLMEFAKLGIRTALHQIAGYQNISTLVLAKPKSLLDLSPTKLYQLATHQLLVESGEKPDPELVNGIDLEYLSVTSDAAFYAYHRNSSEIAKGTKLANDALRGIGWLENSEKEKKKEERDVVYFAKYLTNLDDLLFPGAQDFQQFESRQLSLAGGSNG